MRSLPAALHLLLQLGDRRLVGEPAQWPRVAEVDHRVEQRDVVDPVVLDLVEVGGGHHREGATQAQPDHVDLLRRGDLADHVERRERAVQQVVVHGRARHRGVRVSVADREDGTAVLHRPLDEAAPGRQVHDVVLVDPRRAAQQRDLVYLLGLRQVLEDLDQVAAVHHLRRGAGEVAADLERAGVHLPGPAVVVQHVVDEVAPAVDEAAPAGVQRPLEYRRIGDREVGRRERVGEEPHRQLRLALVHRVQIGDAQQVHAVLAGGEVGLPQCPERRVLLPGRVAEPAVARVHPHRALRRLAGEAVERGGAGTEQLLAEAERQRQPADRVLGRGPGGGGERLPQQRRVVVGEQRGLGGQEERRLRRRLVPVRSGHDPPSGR